jgi:hypothetical protein
MSGTSIPKKSVNLKLHGKRDVLRHGKPLPNPRNGEDAEEEEEEEEEEGSRDTSN